MTHPQLRATLLLFVLWGLAVYALGACAPTKPKHPTMPARVVCPGGGG